MGRIPLHYLQIPSIFPIQCAELLTREDVAVKDSIHLLNSKRAAHGKLLIKCHILTSQWALLRHFNIFRTCKTILKQVERVWYLFLDCQLDQ